MRPAPAGAHRAWAGALVLFGLLVLLGAGVPMTTTGAAWQVSDSDAGNTYSTAIDWGPMYSWGTSDKGRSGVVLEAAQTTRSLRAVGLETWASGAGGFDSTCMITTAGALYCWGSNSDGQIGDGTTTTRFQPVAVAPGSTWSQVTKGLAATCAIKATNSTLWCWGDDTYGQAGNGSTTTTPVTAPAQVVTSGLSSWTWVSASQYFACGLKTDATLWCWGYGGNGRLGTGGTANVNVPTQVGTATWAQVDTAAASTCAIQASDHSLWCWGQAANGQLGNGTTTPDLTSPARSSTASWSWISRGANRYCGLRTAGTIFCWGYGLHGGNGNGSTADASTPVQEATASTTWNNLTTTLYGACATRTSGALYCWGDNTSGAIGDGSTTDRPSPVLSGSATDWTALIGGNDNFCGIRSVDRGLWCQGSDANGKSGYYYNNQAGAPSPLVPPSSTWTLGSIGYEGGCGLRSGGTLWCWGINSQGEAGQGDTVTHDFPLQVGSGTDWSAVSVGTYTTCGLRAAGAMYCDGDGANNQFGNATTADQSTMTAAASGRWLSVSVGDSQTCAISVAGALSCWGANPYGQVGNGTTTAVSTPVTLTVTGVSTWASVSAGYDSTCAIAASGADAGGLYCWGRNNLGQVGDGSTTLRSAPVRVGSATWSSVAVGYEVGCGVQTSGALACWGANGNGELGQGGTAGTPASASSPQTVGSVTSWKSVGVGDGFGCANRTDASTWCWGKDNAGQLGDRGSTTRTSPQQVPLLSASWVDAHARAEGSLAMP